MKKVLPVLTYSDFYGTKVIPELPLENVRKFDLESVIVVLILLRKSLDKRTVTDINNPTIQALIQRFSKSKSNRLVSFLTNPGAPYILTHSVVISKIIVDLFKILKYNAPEESMNSSKLEEAILDLLLIYNEQHYGAVLEPKPDDHEVIWRLALMQDITGVDEVDYSRTAVPKHLIFMKFLKFKLGDNFKNFECKLFEITGTNNVLEFLLILLNVYLAATDNKNILTAILKEDRVYQILIDAGLVIDEAVAADEKFNLGTLISHPFFKTSKGEMYLIDHSDFALIVDKIWSFFLFSKNEIRTLLPNIETSNNYHSFLGKDFVEQYLMRTLFKSLDKKGNRVIFTDDVNLPDISLVLNEKDVFVFEIKASALHYDVVGKQDILGFKEFLDSNFAEGKKGVKQLINNIGYLSNDSKNLYNLRIGQRKLTVYPVIIFTDPHLSKNAVNDYINVKTDHLFEEYKPKFKEIKPVTMISSDFFMENLLLLQQDRSLVKRMINAYHQNFKKKMEKYSKFRSTSNYMEAMISFDMFVAGREKIYRIDKTKIFNNMTEIFKLREE